VVLTDSSSITQFAPYLVVLPFVVCSPLTRELSDAKS
jgi:hypothetical protein